eukprot:4290164-Prorocentrum_lima.AAC.1
MTSSLVGSEMCIRDSGAATAGTASGRNDIYRTEYHYSDDATAVDDDDEGGWHGSGVAAAVRREKTTGTKEAINRVGTARCSGVATAPEVPRTRTPSDGDRFRTPSPSPTAPHQKLPIDER